MTPAQTRREENVKMIFLLLKYPLSDFMKVDKVKAMAKESGWTLREFQEILNRVHDLQRKGMLDGLVKD
jgi:hypothetical protein